MRTASRFQVQAPNVLVFEIHKRAPSQEAHNLSHYKTIDVLLAYQ